MTKQNMTVSYLTTGTKSKNGKVLKGKRKHIFEGFFLTTEDAIATANNYLSTRVGTYFDTYEITGVEVSDTIEVEDTNSEDNNNPIKEEKEVVKMERANKLTVETTEQGYVAHFYRTHKHIADIEIPTENAEHSNSLRESARTQAIEKCEQYGIMWNPETQKQAWDRKYNTYMTDEEVAEDTLTLVTPAIERLVEKCKYDLELLGIEISAVTPKLSNLTYIENGRYTKNNAWCCADIEVIVKTKFLGDELDIRYNAELKSGQLCKPKTTILEWNLMVLNEITLNGIEIPVEE